jgi:hypothetical protein
MNFYFSFYHYTSSLSLVTAQWLDKSIACAFLYNNPAMCKGPGFFILLMN